MINTLATHSSCASENADELAAILARGVIRYLRVQQAYSASGAEYADNVYSGVSVTQAQNHENQEIPDQNSASKTDLPVVSAHGSLSRELTDTEPGKEETKCL